MARHPEYPPQLSCRALWGVTATAFLAVFLAVCIAWSAPPVQAKPNVFEEQAIEAQAVEAFRRIVNLWREEVYFELYEAGMESSKARISPEAFAQRMVELSWVPGGQLNPKFLDGKFRFRTMVYVSARVPYLHKFNSETGFSRDQTVLLVKEAGTWRIDLVRLIRSPYAS